LVKHRKPCLDVDQGGVVEEVKFSGLRATQLNQLGAVAATEPVSPDIAASAEKRHLHERGVPVRL